MITIDDLMGVEKIISHDSCPDGTVSAMICKMAYLNSGIQPEIEFHQYKTEKLDNLPATPGLMFVDFSPPEDRWKEFRDVGTIVLDHHASAKKYIEGEKVIFGEDDKESGASLCFKYVYEFLRSHGIAPYKSNEEHEKWERLANLARIRDTWNKNDPDWEIACNVAQGIIFCSYKWCLEMAEGNLNLDMIERIGRRWRKKILRKAENVAEKCLIISHNDLKIAYYNNTERLASEIGDFLEKRADFSVSYSFFRENENNKCLLSFRSRQGYDVSKLATKLKGGGHPGAAGAMIEFGDTLPGLEHISETIRININNIIVEDVIKS